MPLLGREGREPVVLVGEGVLRSGAESRTMFRNGCSPLKRSGKSTVVPPPISSTPGNAIQGGRTRSKSEAAFFISISISISICAHKKEVALHAHGQNGSAAHTCSCCSPLAP